MTTGGIDKNVFKIVIAARCPQKLLVAKKAPSGKPQNRAAIVDTTLTSSDREIIFFTSASPLISIVSANVNAFRNSIMNWSSLIVYRILLIRCFSQPVYFAFLLDANYHADFTCL